MSSDFLKHSIDWAQGEMSDAVVLACVGLILVVLGPTVHRLSSGPAGKALLMPLLAVGTLFVVAGVYGYLSNSSRIDEFTAAFTADPGTFLAAEQHRVEEFQSLYTYTQIFAALCFTVAVGLFAGSLNPTLRATAVALVLLGLTGLVIDFFSKERADTYYAHIEATVTLHESEPAKFQ